MSLFVEQNNAKQAPAQIDNNSFTPGSANRQEQWMDLFLPVLIRTPIHSFRFQPPSLLWRGIRMECWRTFVWIMLLLAGVSIQAGDSWAEDNLWRSSGPSDELAIAIVPQNSSTIYVGTAGGVQKSADGGVNFASIVLTKFSVSALAVDPLTSSTVYAGTNGGGISKSIDSGVTWADSSTGLPAYSQVFTLAIDPTTPSIIYAATNGGVYKSIDSGANWVACGSLSYLGGIVVVRTLVLDPKTPTTIYAGSSGEVYKSINSGGTWTTSTSGLTNQAVRNLAIDPQTPSTLYVATLNGIYKSTDSGSNWSPSNAGLPSASRLVVIDPKNPSTLYVGINGQGIFKSVDGGASWTIFSAGLPNSPTVSAIAADPATAGIIYAGINYGGIYKSTDGSANWTLLHHSLTGPTNAISVNPSNLWVYAGTTEGVFRSSDGGVSWTPSNGTSLLYYVQTLAIDPQTPATLYAGTIGGTVYKSTDSGGTWTAAVLPSYPTVNTIVVDPTTPANLYAGSSGGLYKSSNSGTTWTSLGLPAGSIVNALAIDPSTSATVYAGTNAGLYKSTDSGSTWNKLGAGLDNLTIKALVIDPQNTTAIFAGTSAGIYKSNDGGNNWSAKKTGLPPTVQVWSLVLDPQQPMNVYASTDQGVFESSSGGENWTLIFQDNSKGLALSPQNPFSIYVGKTDGTVWVQFGTDCVYSLSANAASYSSSGIQSDHVQVEAAGDCFWKAVNNDSWITITSGAGANGSGFVTYSVLPNTSSSSRTGTMTIAGQTFTITQDASSTTLSISSLTPNSGLTSGGALVTINGGGFQSGATVTIGGIDATIISLTSVQIVVRTGIATAPGTYDVIVTNPGGHPTALTGGFTYNADPATQVSYVLVPIVLSSSGLAGSFFTSEMTLTNRGPLPVSVDFNYTAAIGSGSGSAVDSLAPGQQKIYPDAISYLRSLGIPISSTGNQGGALWVSFSGMASLKDAGVTVRTTTVVPEGRAGLSYPGVPSPMTLAKSSYICGLRQNQFDRSNLALLNAGSSTDGAVTLRVTVFSGDQGPSYFHVLPDFVVPHGGFVQISSILASDGITFGSGFARVERISGTAQYYAYGVINDQVNSDGSFIPPIQETSLAGKTRITLPVVVEAGKFSTELVVSNWSSSAKTLTCKYVSDNITTSDASATFSLTVNPSRQLIIPNVVQWLRSNQITGIGPAGSTFAGALFVSVSSGDLNGVFVAARTSSPATNGSRYGLFYTAVAEGTASKNDAWIYGLQQNAENRTNLALINTGEIDANSDNFNVELYDGSTGLKVNTIENISLNAFRWTQINGILGSYANSITEGYAHIVRTAGANPFIAYAVINDGARIGERSDDGSYVASMP